MANLSFYNVTTNSANWAITDLSADFNTSNYIRVGISYSEVSFGQSAPPIFETGTVYAPSTGISRAVSGILTGLDPWTQYRLYGFTQAANGLYYPAGVYTFVTLQETPIRPSNWYWSFNIAPNAPMYSTTVSGNTVNAYVMPASEWNSFTYRVNQFRNYKQLGDYSFVGMGSGDYVTPAVINQAVAAINQMGYNIPSVQAGEIPASVFTQMRDTLNSIN